MVKKAFWVVGWCLWIIICYFLSQLVIIELSSLFGLTNSGGTLINTLLTTLVYVLMLVLAFGGAYAAREVCKTPKFKELAGAMRQISWKDVGYALIYAASYFFVLVVVMLVFNLLLPELAKEEQNIGYAKTGNDLLQLALIFIALVVIAPVAEELAMRGLLFNRLRSKIPFWPTTIIVSLLFALAHGQVNVGIDVFILSLFLCYVREKTGAIYAPIMIHAIKNLLGFLTLFILVL